MSSRNTKFEQNILIPWQEIEKLVTAINSKGLSTEAIDEIAHMKKVITYLSNMLKTIDPDFVPQNILDRTTTPISNIRKALEYYLDTGNFTYINNINNDYLDTLLTNLMPFIFYKGNAGIALKNALQQYTSFIQSSYQDYRNDIVSISEEVTDKNGKIGSILNDLTSKQEKFSEYSENLFNEKDGIKTQISELVTDIQEKNRDISEFHSKIFDQEDSIEDQIKNFLKDSKENKQEILNLKEQSSQTLNELEEFHKDILGITNNDGEIEGGLKNELENRLKELEEFKKQQQTRYQELNTQIESLLPGATSAGLSHAYNEMHSQFNDEVKSYRSWFYRSIFILFFIVCIVTFCFNNIVPKITDPMTLSHRLINILDNLIYKLPFILPAIWLVLFVSKRRNEAQRLAQEYAHKEALAKSYESYKQQIEKLGKEEQNKLLPILMENMLKAISLNPAETLDKNHKEEMPLEEVFKKKEFWEYLDKIKELITLKTKEK